MNETKTKLEHLFLAVIIALVLTVIYAFIAPLFIKGNYDELVIFLGGIGLFFSYIIFYFLFTYFKSINKLKWLFIGIVAFAFLPILSTDYVDLFSINLFNRDKLPEQYKSYQDIGQSNLQFKNKTIKLLFDGDRELKYYLTNKNNLIVSILKYKNNGEEQLITIPYSKLDLQGNVIDSFLAPFDSHYTFFEGYHINEFEDHFITWALNGDTAKRKIKTQNENLSLNTEQENEFIKNIEEKATFIFNKQNYFDDKQSVKRDKIFYFTNNEWFAFYCVADFDRNVITKGISNATLLVPYVSSPYQYFQKIKMERNYNYNGGGHKDQWNGFLYSDIITGKDTLKIKEGLKMDDDWKTQQQKIKNEVVGDFDRENQNGFLPYMVYSNPNLNYQLFTNNLGKLYIIKDK